MAVALLSAGALGDMNVGKVEPRSKTQVRRTEPVYKVEVGLGGEVFPAFANYASFQHPRERKWGTIAVTVENASDSVLRSRIAVHVPGWSDEEIQMVEMGAGDVRTFLFAPTFTSRLYRNREIAAATAIVRVTDEGGRKIFESTAPVRLRAVGDMYWGAAFKYAPFIASWVTPHDHQIEAVLSKAKEFMPGRRLPGYETWKSVEAQERSTYLQARAIFRALQAVGVSYVKSSGTFGAYVNSGVSERVRLPYESIRHASANCIDGAVTYASLFENLGMQPVIVLVPGHAYVAVRLSENSGKFLYIETSTTGRSTFERSVEIAQKGIFRWPEGKVTRIDIVAARRAGIYPLPIAESVSEVARSPKSR